MNISEIKNFFSAKIYSRGREYYRAGRVSDVTSPKANIVTAIVRGSKKYFVNVYFNNDGSLMGMTCTCPYGMYCKHGAALLLYLKDNPNVLKANERAHSSYEVSSLIREFSEKAVTRASVSVEEPVKLIPYLDSYGNTLSLDVKIGREKIYVVQNIIQMCDDFRNNVVKQYGKFLSFRHSPEILRPSDRELLSFLMTYTSIYRYSIMRGITLDDRWVEEFFDSVKEDTIFYKEQTFEIVRGAPKPRVRIKETDAGEGYELSAVSPLKYFGGKNAACLCDLKNQVFYICPKDFSVKAMPFYDVLCRAKEKLFVHKSDMGAFYSTVLLPIKEFFDISGLEMLEEFTPPQVQPRLYLDSTDNDVYARLEFAYDDKVYPAFGDKSENPFCNFLAETEAEALVMKYFGKGDFDNGYSLAVCGDNDIFRLLTEGMEELSDKMEIFATDSFKRLAVRPPASVSVGIRPSGNLLELSFDMENYDLAELAAMLNSYRKGKKFHRLRDGSFAALNEQGMEELSEITSALNISDRSLLKGKLSVPRYRMLYLNSIQNDNEGLRVKRSREFREAADKYNTISERAAEPPEALSKIMRDYQKYGFLWLKTISEYGFGGILADDMGLGKTLQAIALILDEKQSNPDYRPSFVVCPSSLTLNWISEINKFAPELKAAAVIGTAAERAEIINNIGDYDVIITSYPLLVRDIEHYEGMEFGLHFIDEAQFVKNHTTQSAKAVKAVNSKIRFALTGTPVENSLAELWSIFDFIMPDYLFGYAGFKTRFETPIVKNSDMKAAGALRKMTAPFILRRMKKDVLKELPDKTVTTLYAPLEDEQKKLYAANLLALKKSLTNKDAEFERFEVLAMLTRLRRICCDPSLEYEDYNGGSAKLSQCMELVESCVDAGHKILLFSQFTTMLDIIKEKLGEMGISCFMLTGKTKSRERLSMVNCFNKDDTKVFLISLKAGGTGLNLTGADIVIHYDPWWNISAENQASDRAYRIGQKNSVQIYKLIAQNTLEERIEELQRSKAELAELALSSDADIMKMSAEDILELLK